MNKYVESRIKKADALCKSAPVSSVLDEMDSLNRSMQDIADVMESLSEAHYDGLDTIRKNSGDFAERVLALSDELRILIGKISDADIPNMASDLDKPD